MNTTVELMTSVVLPIITGIITWLVARKKNAAEAKTVELENVDKAIGIWRDLAQEQRAVAEKLREEIEAFRLENQDLKAKIQALERKIDALTLN